MCESRGGRSGPPVPNKPDGFCGRKVTLKRKRKKEKKGEKKASWQSSSVGKAGGHRFKSASALPSLLNVVVHTQHLAFVDTAQVKATQSQFKKKM